MGTLEGIAVVVLFGKVLAIFHLTLRSSLYTTYLQPARAEPKPRRECRTSCVAEKSIDNKLMPQPSTTTSSSRLLVPYLPHHHQISLSPTAHPPSVIPTHHHTSTQPTADHSPSHNKPKRKPQITSYPSEVPKAVSRPSNQHHLGTKEHLNADRIASGAAEPPFGALRRQL